MSYSVGVKANIGNFESSDAHLSRTEKWNVKGWTPEEIDAWWLERYTKLKAELDELIMREYREMSQYAMAKEEDGGDGR